MFKDHFEQYLELEDQILSRYKVVDLISHGDNGIVWKV